MIGDEDMVRDYLTRSSRYGWSWIRPESPRFETYVQEVAAMMPALRAIWPISAPAACARLLRPARPALQEGLGALEYK